MSVETKIKEILNQSMPELAAQLGLVAMAAAATIGTLPDHMDRRVVLPNQLVMVRASENVEQGQPIRREKDEAGPHQFISYTVNQRTPGRSGKA